VHILSKRNNAPAQPSRFQHLHRRQVFAAATRNVKKWVGNNCSTLAPYQLLPANKTFQYA